MRHTAILLIIFILIGGTGLDYLSGYTVAVVGLTVDTGARSPDRGGRSQQKSEKDPRPVHGRIGQGCNIPGKDGQTPETGREASGGRSVFSENNISRFGRPADYRLEVTAYTHTGNPTASGVWPRRGTVAVDPQIIPLGTKLYVEGYGYAVAADTGGDIKGYRMDVFLETERDARKWGRKHGVRVWRVN